MTILLFNDNPVVQKLVALSAQKTKDDLSVAASPEGIEGGEYDLLIVDDALYSDEVFATIQETVVYKNALFMATRGKTVPAGFDTIINKPFLPTDLVETLISIEKNLATPVELGRVAPLEPEARDEGYSIDLQETLSALDHDIEDAFLEHPESTEEEAIDFEGLDAMIEEESPKTTVLDEEEVQEVRGLLEDAENDDVLIGEEEGINDSFVLPDEENAEEEALDFDALIGSGTPEAAEPDESLDLEGFDFPEESEGEDESAEEPLDLDALIGTDTPDAAEADEPLDLEGFDFPEESEEVSETPRAGEEAFTLDEGFDFDDNPGLSDTETPAPKEEPDEEFDFGDFPELLGAEDEREETPVMDDEEFGELELKIREAVDELEPEDLECELDEEVLGDLHLGSDEAFGSLDELDTLDERELKLAIGEAVDEAFDAEPAVQEELGAAIAADTPVERAMDRAGDTQAADATPAEGVEALQALLKALADENVAKSLKGLNISININFGNDK